MGTKYKVGDLVEWCGFLTDGEGKFGVIVGLHCNNMASAPVRSHGSVVGRWDDSPQVEVYWLADRCSSYESLTAARWLRVLTSS